MRQDIGDDIQLCISTQERLAYEAGVIAESYNKEIEDKIAELGMIAASEFKYSARRQLETELNGLNVQLRDERKKLLTLQLMFIKWAIVGHNAVDFENAEGPTAFESEDVEFLGKKYRIAADSMINCYASVGDDFVQVLFDAAVNWQKSVVVTAQQAWANASREAEQKASAVKLAMQRVLARHGLSPDGESLNTQGELAIEDDPLK